MSDDLRTEDDIARLFADANPIPNHGRAGDAGHLPADGTRSDVMLDLEEPTQPATRPERRQRRWLPAAAAVAALVAGAVVAAWVDVRTPDDDPNTTRPPLTTPDTLPPNRVAVVEEFVAALSAYDVAAANRMLAPGTVPTLVPGVDGSRDGTVSLDDQLAWLAAVGSTSEIESCREHGETGAYCTVRHRDRLGDLVPIEMPGTMLYGFEDGLIDELVVTTEFGVYRSEALSPFHEWLVEHHPDDVARLWTEAGSDGVLPVVTRDAAELMDARLTEYIEAHTAARAAAAADVTLAQAEPFVEWVAATYPEDLRAMWRFGSGGISANRNDTTIPLFEAHLDEWSSSDPLPTPAHRAFLAAQAGGDIETMGALIAPDVVVDQLWASSAGELPGLSRLLTGLAWDWNLQSCSVSRDDPDPVRTGISCVAAPTWRLDDRDIDVPSTIVDFEFTSAGIASVSTGPWLERSAADLAPLFDWIRTVHPDVADALLAEREGTTVPVLSDASVDQLLGLVDEFLARAEG
jgi:hypothetical protein